eukprot:2041679-Pleurochrysis_carterae.AAC.1
MPNLSCRRGRKALCKQMAALFLSQWRQHRHVWSVAFPPPRRVRSADARVRVGGDRSAARKMSDPGPFCLQNQKEGSDIPLPTIVLSLRQSRRASRLRASRAVRTTARTRRPTTTAATAQACAAMGMHRVVHDCRGSDSYGMFATVLVSRPCFAFRAHVRSFS